MVTYNMDTVSGRLPDMDKEDRAETTFQNALLFAELIRKHEVRSAMLLIDDYHMSRSSFLLMLHLYRKGSGDEALTGANRTFWPQSTGLVKPAKKSRVQ